MNAKTDNAAYDRFNGFDQTTVKNEGFDDGPCGLETEHVAIHVDSAKRTVVVLVAVFMKVHNTRHSDGQDKEDHGCDGDIIGDCYRIFHELK